VHGKQMRKKMLFRHTVQQFEDEVYLLISHNLKENRYSIAHLPCFWLLVFGLKSKRVFLKRRREKKARIREYIFC